MWLCLNTMGENMRINELEKRVQDLGRLYDVNMVVQKKAGYLFVTKYESRCYSTIATVSLKNELRLNTNTKTFEELPEKLKEELFNILAEFAKTPTDKREEEKKYEYRLKEKYLWINDKLNLGNCYLNFEFSQEGGRGDVVLDSRGNTDSFKTEFTDGEIKEIADMLYIDLEMFDKFEVK